MPQKVPTNGTAVMISYTALLNTQGRMDAISFKFIVGLMRELSDQYQLIESTEIEINSGIPLIVGGYNSTIHPDSATIPNWQVQEGDQFAVFVYNTCENDFCPANMNLLNKDDCESTWYQPFVFNPFQLPPGLYSVDKSDPFLRRAPIQVNIEISVGKQKTSLLPTMCISGYILPVICRAVRSQLQTEPCTHIISSSNHHLF